MSKVATDTPRTLPPFNPELAKLSLDLGLTLRIITEILGCGVIPFSIRLVDGDMIILLSFITSLRDAPAGHGTSHLRVRVDGFHLTMLNPCTGGRWSMEPLEFHHR
jgi:hypothetical protein